MPDLSRFSIYHDPSANQKRDEEATNLMPFLLRLEEFVKLDDVEFGAEPPDFVFHHQNKIIGVELTDMVPKQFSKGGYRRREAFKAWKAECKQKPQPHHEFKWGEFTLRESLAAFANQVEGKARKADKWKVSFEQKWLLMHVANGSPFSVLVASSRKDSLGREEEMADYFAKVTHTVFSICSRPHPFNYVILFSGQVLIAFPANDANPLNFPVADSDILSRGANAPDRFLDWTSTLRSFLDHPLLK
ncbi:MAG TPA: hypothetical protein VN887_18075 [Candidatus Angelobacter sp.]|nr:hypothetical protein [Candidatus Angelobacter sp.]